MSRLIKSQYTINNDDDKQSIAVKTIHVLLNEKYKNSTDRNGSQHTSIIIQSAKEEAEHIIHSALSEKDKIEQQIEAERGAWEQEKEQLFEQARQEGYAEGLEIGRQEAFRQYKAHIEESQRIVDLAQKDYDETVQSAEEAILALSIKVASKVLDTKLSELPECFLPLVKQGLNEVKEYEDIKIHVHPTYYELLLSQKVELKLVVTNDTDIIIYPNAELDINDCIIESAYGRVDISIDTQLEQLKKQLMQLLE